MQCWNSSAQQIFLQTILIELGVNVFYTWQSLRMHTYVKNKNAIKWYQPLYKHRPNAKQTDNKHVTALSACIISICIAMEKQTKFAFKQVHLLL